MQRLFSTFAGGWPGVGLLLQRILAAVLLLRFAIIDLTGPSFTAAMIPEAFAACAGMLLLIGLWTPIAGGLIAALELWLALTQSDYSWIPIILATLAGTIAMIGPGAFSVDARLFGRKHIET